MSKIINRPAYTPKFKSAAFTAYNKAMVAVRAGKLDKGRVNRAFGLVLSGELANRPYDFTKNRCTCPDSKMGNKCKHRIAARMFEIIGEEMGAPDLYAEIKQFAGSVFNDNDNVQIWANGQKNVFLSKHQDGFVYLHVSKNTTPLKALKADVFTGVCEVYAGPFNINNWARQTHILSWAA